MGLRDNGATQIAVTVLVVAAMAFAPTAVGGFGPEYGADRGDAFAADRADASAAASADVQVSALADDRASVQASAPSDAAVERAVDDSRSHLLNSMRDDHWASNVSSGRGGIWDVRFSLYYALMLERLDENPESKRAAVEWALEQRNDDGGWNDTVANFAALLLFEKMNGSEYADAAAAVRAENRRKNVSLTAVSASNDTSFVEDNLRLKLLYATMSDRYSNEQLFGESGPGQFAELARMTPAFEDGVHPNRTFVVPDTVDLTLSMTLLGLSAQREVGWPNGNRSEEIDLTANLLIGRRLPNGVWATTIDNVFAIFALHEAGYDADDPEVARAVERMRTARQMPSGRMLGFRLPVWDTAWSMNALVASGVSPHNETVEAAAQWLYDSRVERPIDKRGETALDRLPLPFRKHWGDGWGYKPHMYSDWDDTAVALTAMEPYDDRIVREDVEYLFRVQNSDGSWSAFMTDFEPLNESERERVVERGGREMYRQLFTNHPAPDVTGHALKAVGEHGYTVENNESVRAAVDYLLDARTDNGTWQAVWGQGGLYGTSRVVEGLHAVGVDVDRPEVQQATEALVEKQNDDGGWGQYAGESSDPTYTAWAVETLLTAGYSADHPAVEQGVTYLLDAQREDGSWETTRMMHNLGRLEYSLSVFTQASALSALSAYADAKGIDVAPDASGESRDSTGGPAGGIPDWLSVIVAELVVALGGVLVIRGR